MADRSGDTGASPIVEGNYSAVAQWELYLSLTLLAGNFSGNGTVHFVGEPVFTSDCFELEHSFYVFVELRLIVCYVFVSFFDRSVCHDGTGGFPEHVFHRQVDGLNTIGLFEYEAMVACGFAYYIERSPFAVGDLTNVLDVFFPNDDTHTLLTFVTYDFFGR